MIKVYNMISFHYYVSLELMDLESAILGIYEQALQSLIK